MGMYLNKREIKYPALWEAAHIKLFKYNIDEMTMKTKNTPKWVHFGAGNIFRGFIAPLQDTLLENRITDIGIIAVAPHDMELIDKIYKPYDNLSLVVLMDSDRRLNKRVIGSVAESLVGDSLSKDWDRLKEIFEHPALQMVSFTVTEKGYKLYSTAKEYTSDVKYDIDNGPEKPKHLISKITSLLYQRYKGGQLPIALVSMDNCSHNGDVLRDAVCKVAGEWIKREFVEAGFLDYLNNTNKVSFPWTMIDKIIPRPSQSVKIALESVGFKSTEIYCTQKNTYIAPFVNGETVQYLVVEDNFPNGRMPLEVAGVIFTDRNTVDRVEKMKVCTCLNPLHTALAIFGCLLGYKTISYAVKDIKLKRLIEYIGYKEGMPVVADPGIIDPFEFINEVINERLANPNIPDTPQRIATDTSQKIPIRYGETIKAYCNNDGLDINKLIYIPITIAGWCRYLIAVDDNGEPMELSPDPMLEELTSYLQGVELGKPETLGDKLKPILSNENIFGKDLYSIGLGERIDNYVKEMLIGKNAVRQMLDKYISN